MLTVSPAHADLPIPEGKNAYFSNADVIGKCSLGVAGVDNSDPNNPKANTNLAAEARGKQLSSIGNNVWTEVHCFVTAVGGGPILASLDVEQNGSFILSTRKTVVLDYLPEYQICGYAEVKLRSSVTSTTNLVCSG